MFVDPALLAHRTNHVCAAPPPPPPWIHHSFCRCAQPYNPDREMAMCDGCEEWWHAECAQCARDAMRSPDWRCPDCLARGG